MRITMIGHSTVLLEAGAGRKSSQTHIGENGEIRLTRISAFPESHAKN